MPFKLIIFDWDGTLVDSHGRIISAMQAAIEDLKLTERTRLEIENIIGLGLLEASISLYPELSRDTHEKLVDTYRQQYLQQYDSPNPLFPDAKETMAKLIEQDHMLAVATGKSRKGLERDLSGLNVGEFLIASRCADETESKPSPKMLYELMQELGVEASETCMIGDSLFDLEMAKKANVPAVGIAYEEHRRQQLFKYGPLDVIDSLRCLPKLLTKLNPI